MRRGFVDGRGLTAIIVHWGAAVYLGETGCPVRAQMCRYFAELIQPSRKSVKCKLPRSPFLLQ